MRKRAGAGVVLGAAVAGLFAAGIAQAASLRIHINRLSEPPTITVVRAAERGSAAYQTRLGYMYEIGRGVPQDYQLAAAWYYRAAQQGNVRAQHLLGMLYDKGQGVAIDHVEAHKWLNLAASSAPSVDRDYYVRIRNAVASKLTRDQIYDAQRRAREWYPIRDR